MPVSTGVHPVDLSWEQIVADVVFVLVILGGFALLTLIAKGIERL
ncbi:MAG: hypothetical protein JWP14_154 [Frankiales bacterium]|nr:hypothetical protein [Frankiales bacterium]